MNPVINFRGWPRKRKFNSRKFVTRKFYTMKISQTTVVGTSEHTHRPNTWYTNHCVHELDSHKSCDLSWFTATNPINAHTVTLRLNGTKQQLSYVVTDSSLINAHPLAKLSSLLRTFVALRLCETAPVVGKTLST